MQRYVYYSSNTIIFGESVKIEMKTLSCIFQILNFILKNTSIQLRTLGL